MTTRPASARYRLRSITPRDQARLRRFYAGLSTDSRIARFHGTSSTIPEAMAASFCHPDHRHREGVVAETFDAAGYPEIIGHICVEPIDEHTAEMAIAVADAWHRHGVGRAMLANAILWGQRHGFASFVASMECGNAPMFVLLRSMGYPITYGSSDGGTVDARLDLRGTTLAA